MASELRPLLRTVRETQPFGPKGYGIMTSTDYEQVYEKMEGVRAGFEDDMGHRLEQGFPHFNTAIRTAILGDTSLLAVAFSAGLSNGELEKDPLIKMATLTAITGVANRLIDKGDPLMRNATVRWCEDPESMPPKEQASRFNFMRGIDEIMSTVVTPEDCEATLSVMRNLMAANVGAHDMTMKWKDTDKEHEAAFWDNHADEVVRNLLITGAVPSATVPLLGMYHQQDSGVASVSEAWGNPFVQTQCERANVIIRFDDDFGDRRRDASPERMSINLFNVASSVHGKRVIGRFCVAAGINDEQTIDTITTAFHDIGTGKGRPEEAMQLITHELEQNFWDANQRVPDTFDKHTTLVIRALAAGRANAIGDDALVEQRHGS